VKLDHTELGSVLGWRQMHEQMFPQRNLRNTVRRTGVT